jgi:hypothetical protein
MQIPPTPFSMKDLFILNSIDLRHLKNRVVLNPILKILSAEYKRAYRRHGGTIQYVHVRKNESFNSDSNELLMRLGIDERS